MIRPHIELKKGMKFAYLNVGGLRRSLAIHVLALNETKLDSHYPKELTCIPGYHQERLDRTVMEGGGFCLYRRLYQKYVTF